MKLSEETVCIATPGFAGFVPSLRYQFGATYGNATRHILKQGKLQQDYQERVSVKNNAAAAKEEAVKQQVENGKYKSKYADCNNDTNGRDNYVLKVKNKYHTGDDRFSFPPVPGYTGFIPRSREHFGHPYVETTNESLLDFQKMLKSKEKLPKKVEAIIKQRQEMHLQNGNNGPQNSDMTTTSSTNTTATTQKNNSNISKPSFCYSASASSIDDVGPYKAPKGHKNQTFISGYTGFVPRLQKHFGEPYPESVRHAIEDFTIQKTVTNPYANGGKRLSSEKRDKIIETRPIPGCTVFIPGSKYGFATTFGRTSEIAYDAFNHREKGGKMPLDSPNSSFGQGYPIKDLKKNKPIAGYRGFQPQGRV